jgi:hypothetical protein
VASRVVSKAVSSPRRSRLSASRFSRPLST